MSSLRTDLAARRTGTALLLLLLFVAAQAYVTVHHAVVAHEVCAVDGQLSHADHGHGHDADHEHDADVPDGPVAKKAHSDDGHGDDHCAVPTVRDERKSLTSSRAPSLVAFETPSAPALFRAQDAERQVPVFRLAPKQSPPRRA